MNTSFCYKQAKKIFYFKKSKRDLIDFGRHLCDEWDGMNGTTSVPKSVPG